MNGSSNSLLISESGSQSFSLRPPLQRSAARATLFGGGHATSGSSSPAAAAAAAPRGATSHAAFGPSVVPLVCEVSRRADGSRAATLRLID